VKVAEAYIVAAARTAGGRREGKLKDVFPADLGAAVVNELLARTKVDPALVDDLITGCVSQVGAQGFNIARQIVLSSSLPHTVPGVTVDRQCGSSQQAIHFAAQAVMSGSMDIVIAAGVEHMTMCPLGSAITAAVKAGMRVQQGSTMQQRYPEMSSQFVSAERVAKKYRVSKDECDELGFLSHQRAIAAVNAGHFKAQIVPIEVTDAEGKQVVHTVDEGIRFNAELAAIKGVKLLVEGGILTAATSSQICDGAAGVMVVNEVGLKRLGVQPLARIHHMTVVGSDPTLMLDGPIPATQRLLQKSGMKIEDIDLYEVNEAFASIPLAWLKAVNADPAKLNVHGGAMALGHPTGASGAKLMATLIYALEAQNKRWGLQTMCEGGGIANCTVIERLN
jgi:acetyl-CoA C-acetyltransferase